MRGLPLKRGDDCFLPLFSTSCLMLGFWRRGSSAGAYEPYHSAVPQNLQRFPGQGGQGAGRRVIGEMGSEIKCSGLLMFSVYL
jgi:hypothetical protein